MSAKELLDPVQQHVQSIALEFWDTPLLADMTLRTMLEPTWHSIAPILDYVGSHPWLLLIVLPSAIDVWLLVLGFGLDGIRAGSIASKIHSGIGNVPKRHWFSFLQSYGANRFVKQAIVLGTVGIVVALLLATIGWQMNERGIGMADIEQTLHVVWNKTMELPKKGGGMGDGTKSAVVRF